MRFFTLGPPLPSFPNDDYGEYSWSQKFKALVVSRADGPSEELIVCSRDGRHRSYGKWIRPLAVEVPRGPLGDFMWTYSGHCIISDRIKRLFDGSAFVGYETRELTIAKGVAPQRQELYEFRVVGANVKPHPSAGIKLLNHCPACGLSEYTRAPFGREVVDLSTWNGADFFRMDGVYRWMVSQRARDCIVKNCLTNCVIGSAPEPA